MSRRAAALVIAVLALPSVVAGCSGSDDASSGSPASTTGPKATTTTEVLDCTPPESGARTVTIDGQERSFGVAVPAEFVEPAPVVVLFHGYGSSGDGIAEVTGLADMGPSEGVVVVTPLALGTPSSWQIVQGFATDKAFVDEVIDEVTASDCVDPERVWLAGFSAGSAFTGVYGCGRADASEGSVAGLMMVSGLPPALCPEDATPRVLVVNGTADAAVSFQGGEQNVNGTMVALDTIPESVAKWAARAGCATGPTDSAVGDDIDISSWTDCTGGGPVDLVAVDGGGHAWPGGSEQAIGGVTTQTVSGSCLLLGLVADPDAAVADVAADCPGDHPDLAPR